jgi:hypothetical protein
MGVEMSLPLYHADYIGSAFSLLGQCFVYKKLWWGWVLCAVGNAAFLYMNAVVGLWGMWPVSIFAMSMSVWSAVKWRRS